MRRCSRTACGKPAVATLTYMYADQTAVLGQLATYAEPHSYDLCVAHASGLTAPVGWDVVRLITEFPDPPEDDLFDMAEAMGTPTSEAQPEAPPAPSSSGTTRRSTTRRASHLRVLNNLPD